MRAGLHNAKSDETKLKKSQRRVDELEKLIQSAYEDKVLGSLSVESFKKLAAKYEEERDELTAVIEEIKTRLAESDSDLADVDSFLSVMKKYVNIEQLDREILLELIDKIEVGEVYEENGTEIRDVVIHYRFVDTIAATIATKTRVLMIFFMINTSIIILNCLLKGRAFLY
jgi:hypothetical protein